jgi:hypothetical protein
VWKGERAYRERYQVQLLRCTRRSRTSGRRFAVEADVLLKFIRPMCGENDHPVYFDPEKMQRGGANESGEVLDNTDLRELAQLASVKTFCNTSILPGSKKGSGGNLLV